MATRLGIDLSPAACRVVEIDAGPAWRRPKGETRVRSFAVLPPSGPETQAKLESLRKRHAAVVVWDVPSDHRQVMVTSGSYESMRAEALGALAAAGLQTYGAWADIAPASGRRDRATRRLVAARPLAWGYVDELDALRGRDDITTCLADALREFVTSVGASSRDIGQVCICGGLPELRTMTTQLMERLDVEVEPLDSLFGIDAALLPEPADEFRERGAELRLAWAAAADWPAPINLLRARNRHASKTMLARTAVAAGVAAGLVVAWRVEQSQWWRSTAPKPVTRTAANEPPRSRGGVPAPTRTPAMAPPTMVNRPAAAMLPPRVNTTPVGTSPPAAMNKPPLEPAVVNKAPVVLEKPPVMTLPPRRESPARAPEPPLLMAPPVTPRADDRKRRTAPFSVEPPTPVRSAQVVRPSAVTPVAPREPVPTHGKPTPPLEVALPFDAV